MRTANVYYQEKLAGVLMETDDGEYIFRYENNYVINNTKDEISFSFPVRREPFVADRLFSFFEGLIPEGWLLDIATKNWKLNQNDRMGLLLACCRNCIGAVSISPGVPYE